MTYHIFWEVSFSAMFLAVITFSRFLKMDGLIPMLNFLLPRTTQHFNAVYCWNFKKTILLMQGTESHCLLAHFGVWLYIFTLFRSQGLVTLVKHSHACCVRPMFCHRFEEEFSLQLRKLSGVHYSCTENSADKLPGWPSDTKMPRPVFSFDECVIPSVLT